MSLSTLITFGKLQQYIAACLAGGYILVLPAAVHLSLGVILGWVGWVGIFSGEWAVMLSFVLKKSGSKCLSICETVDTQPANL